MPYIGNTSPSRFVSNRAASVYSGDGSTTAFTLEQAVAQDEDVLVSVDGVIQEPSVAYAVSNGTTLTFTGAPSSDSGNNIFVYYLASQVGTVGHPAAQNLSAGTGTFSGAITGGGLLTTGGNIVIPNAGNIGSASDTDAMSISSGGVVTFSQQPVGTAMVKLLDATISSAVSEYDIDSTYINSTYDSYQLFASLLPATDGANAYGRVFVGGSVQTGTIYAIEVAGRDASGYVSSNGTEQFYFNGGDTIGNATGEGITYNILMLNVNSTTRPFTIEGGSSSYTTSGNHKSNGIGGSLIVANASNVVNGFRLYFNTGNIASGTVKLYGIA